MRFKADENLPQSAITLLKDAGHDVHTVFDEGLSGALDGDLLAASDREARTLITLDKDFGDIRTYAPDAHAGIVVLRPQEQTTVAIAALIARVLKLLTQHGVTGKLWIVDEQRVRVRQ